MKNYCMIMISVFCLCVIPACSSKKSVVKEEASRIEQPVAQLDEQFVHVVEYSGDSESADTIERESGVAQSIDSADLK
jgi:hypothetical protein